MGTPVVEETLANREADFLAWINEAQKLRRLKETDETRPRIEAWFAKEREFKQKFPERLAGIRQISAIMADAFPNFDSPE